jgi:hypothetical protein
MNWLSFVLGIITGLAILLVPSYGVGMYLKRHPQIMVRRMMRGMRASSHMHE